MNRPTRTATQVPVPVAIGGKGYPGGVFVRVAGKGLRGEMSVRVAGKGLKVSCFDTVTRRSVGGVSKGLSRGAQAVRDQMEPTGSWAGKQRFGMRVGSGRRQERTSEQVRITDGSMDCLFCQ
jgi:hypothetical protein